MGNKQSLEQHLQAIEPYYEKTFQRHERDKERVANGTAPHLRFNKKIGLLYVHLLQQLKHYKGEWAGQNFVLEPWQKKSVAIWAGWEYENSDGEWVRRFSDSFWFLPKKNGKTILASGLAIVDTIVRGEEGGEVYAYATQRKQAQLAWNGFEKLLKSNKELRELTRIAYNTITFAKNDTTFETFGRDSDSVEGVSPTFAVADERHLHRDNSVQDNVTTAMIARKQPHHLVITTAGINIEGVCHQDYKYAKDVLNGIIEDDRYFAFVAEAPPVPENIDKIDWFMSEEVWRAANPNYGVSVRKEGMQKRAKEAIEKPEKMTSFLTKHLNVWDESTEGFVTMAEWNACKVDKLDLSGRKIVGLDLSFADDFSSKVELYQSKCGKYFDLVPRSYIPKESIKERDAELRIPLYQWVREGKITATEGKSIDQEYILDDLASGLDKTDYIGYDATYAKWIINRIEGRYGFDNCVMVRQTTWGLTFAMNFLRNLIREKRIRHLGDPVMDWHMSNVRVTRDNQGNIKPDRTRARDKIDLVAGTLNALACVVEEEDTEQKSVYEERGLRKT